MNEQEIIKLIDHLQVVTLEKTDVLVLHTRRILQSGLRDILVEDLQRAFPNNKVVVIEDNMTLGVVRGAE